MLKKLNQEKIDYINNPNGAGSYFSFPKRSDVIKFYEQGSKFFNLWKKFYLTIDLEEWYHLLYFKNIQI